MSCISSFQPQQTHRQSLHIHLTGCQAPYTHDAQVEGCVRDVLFHVTHAAWHAFEFFRAEGPDCLFCRLDRLRIWVAEEEREVVDRTMEEDVAFGHDEDLKV